MPRAPAPAGRRAVAPGGPALSGAWPAHGSPLFFTDAEGRFSPGRRRPARNPPELRAESPPGGQRIRQERNRAAPGMVIAAQHPDWYGMRQVWSLPPCANPAALPPAARYLRKMHGWPVSRILSRRLVPLARGPPWMTIPLPPPLRTGSSCQPGPLGLKHPCGGIGCPTGPARGPYSALLRAGLAMPFLLPGPRWALTPPFHHHRTGLRPEPAARLSLLCCAFPRVTPAGSYPAPLLHGVRTFLGTTLARPPRSSGHPCEAGIRRLPRRRQPENRREMRQEPAARGQSPAL